jgi:2-polyprenyl-6-methoxyphenol hydroxylase-like FAD-dependent oxidoreductase
MASTVPLTILIIGNGVAGPVLAMALQKVTPHKIILVDSGPEDAKKAKITI